MAGISAFRSDHARTAYCQLYDAAVAASTMPVTESDLETSFGRTHVLTAGIRRTPTGSDAWHTDRLDVVVTAAAHPRGGPPGDDDRCDRPSVQEHRDQANHQCLPISWRGLTRRCARWAS